MPRSSAGILAKICDAFTDKPLECTAASSTQLSDQTPAPGFGYNGTGSTTNANCS